MDDSEIISFDNRLENDQKNLFSTLRKLGFFPPKPHSIEPTKKIILCGELLDFEEVKNFLISNNLAEELIKLVLKNSDLLLTSPVMLDETKPVKRTNVLGFMSEEFFANLEALKLEALKSSTATDSQS